MLRDYIKNILVLCIVFWLPTQVFAADPKNLFIEGQDYIKLPDKVRDTPESAQLLNADPHKVQVLFFFSYGCHGCEIFHTPFQKWAKQQLSVPNSKVAVYVYPVSFNPQWHMLAKLYYVMQTLDPQGKLTEPIFTAVLKNRIKLWDPLVMKKFFAQHGFSATQFDQAYNSFNVNRQVKRADDISKAFTIIVTPDIVINGPVNSYKLDLSKAGNNSARLLQILDYLVARESKLLVN